jgi:ATP synthase proteolipid subunit
MIDIVPVIMAGIIGIYGLVVSVLISDGLKQDLPLYTGFIQLGAGLSVGLAGLAAGLVSRKCFVHDNRADRICLVSPSVL